MIILCDTIIDTRGYGNIAAEKDTQSTYITSKLQPTAIQQGMDACIEALDQDY